MAKAAGIGKSYMSLMVSGKRNNPAAVKLLWISQVLEVTVNELYTPPPTKVELARLRKFQPKTIESLLESGS